MRALEREKEIPLTERRRNYIYSGRRRREKKKIAAQPMSCRCVQRQTERELQLGQLAINQVGFYWLLPLSSLLANLAEKLKS